MRRLLKVIFSRLLVAAVLVVLQIYLLFIALYRAAIYYSLLPILSAIGIVMALYINTRNEDPSYRLSWTILVLSLPVLGVMLYLLCAGRKMPQKLARGTTMASHRMADLLSQDKQVIQDLEEDNPDYAKIFKYNIRTSNLPVYRNTTSRYFRSGEEFFPVYLEELKKAKHFIFMEYFIIDDGEVWQKVLEILKEKAAAGVEVKLIYDDFGCSTTMPRNFAKKMNALGIETYRFNRIRPMLLIQMNNRDHRKITVIDNNTAFTGGINLADEYMNIIKRYGYWKDSAVMIKGDAVWSFTDMFLGMYSFLKNDDESIRYGQYNLPHEIENGTGYYQPFSDTPTDGADVGLSVHLNMINSAKKYVYIDTPYLVLNEDIKRSLCLAAANGVDVRILVPHIPDKRYVFAMTKANYDTLLSEGIRIYEFTPGFNHTKNIVVDDELALVGSINTDYRSYYLHLENGVLMYDREIAKEMREDFLQALDLSKEVTLEESRKVFIIIRLFRLLLHVMAPLF
ncbi:MAG: cardiolipin synthase [Solobacterium sp.]|nr:cardiolipin synthase [Solobacterium sp.]